MCGQFKTDVKQELVKPATVFTFSHWEHLVTWLMIMRSSLMTCPGNVLLCTQVELERFYWSCLLWRNVDGLTTVAESL